MAYQNQGGEAPNPNQLAPGAEAGTIPQDTPYAGWRPHDHIGYPLNQSLQIGIASGRS